MPRQRRQESESGFYHLMLRGVNRQQIFEDDGDRASFLSFLEDAKTADSFGLFAYCLMGNHIHLLVRQGGVHVGTSVKRFASRFASWYNVKYERVGPLFQGRYASETIEDEARLLAACRYIHLNPVKARMCDRPQDYQPSSFLTYFNGVYDGLVDVDEMYEIVPRNELLGFHELECSDTFIDDEPARYRRLTDDEARDVIFACGGGRTVSEFKRLCYIERNRALKAMVEAGVPLNQISRLTGSCFRTIKNAAAGA